MKAYKCCACVGDRDPCYLLNACDGEYDDPDKTSCPYDGTYLGRRAGHDANWNEIDVAEITVAIKDVKQSRSKQEEQVDKDLAQRGVI